MAGSSAQAGGTVTGTVALTQEFVDANSAEKLRSVVNSSIVPAGTQLSTKLVDQGSQAGDLLGIALLINRNPETPPVDDPQRDTVLAALRDTGFLTYGTERIGAANTALIVTGGALGDDAGNQGATVARFAAGMAPHGSGTVLAGRDGSATGTAAVAVTRSDAGMAAAVSTVDDISAESGRITTVLALQDLINGGRTGQYGIGQGATSVTVRSKPLTSARQRRLVGVGVRVRFPWVGRPQASLAQRSSPARRHGGCSCHRYASTHRPRPSTSSSAAASLPHSARA